MLFVFDKETKKYTVKDYPSTSSIPNKFRVAPNFLYRDDIFGDYPLKRWFKYELQPTGFLGRWVTEDEVPSEVLALRMLIGDGLP